MADIFDLFYQWQLYLERCKVKESQLGEDQKREMQRAFFGAIGQLLILLRDDISVYKEEDAANIMQRMLDQVGKFWDNEMVKHAKLN